MKTWEEDIITDVESLNTVGPSSVEEIIEDSDDEESVIVNVDKDGDKKMIKPTIMSTLPQMK